MSKGHFWHRTEIGEKGCGDTTPHQSLSQSPPPPLEAERQLQVEPLTHVSFSPVIVGVDLVNEPLNAFPIFLGATGICGLVCQGMQRVEEEVIPQLDLP